jgi:cytochrome c oxidase cbb3-type subunit 3
MTSSSIHPPPATAVGDAASATAAPGAKSPAKGPALLEHEYDGIREYDSPMPRWWVMAFWATFFFSIGYTVHYHFTGHGKSVAEDYEDDLRIARAERAKQTLAEAPSELALGALMADPDLMQDAKVVFAERCAVCHAAEGQGLIGPNLTDDHFIHGENTLMDIYAAVSRGVPEKGMPAWDLQLQPIEVRKLSAYVGTLRGKNLSGKAAEGQPVPKR